MHLFGYLKLLFWISEIVIFHIQNKYFGYQKLCQTAFYLRCPKSYFGYQKQQFQISENKHLFRISKIVILDTRNSCFGYP